MGERLSPLLRRLREAHGATLRQIAERWGTSTTYVARVHRLRDEVPSVERLRQLADLYGVDPLPLYAARAADTGRVVVPWPAEEEAQRALLEVAYGRGREGG